MNTDSHLHRWALLIGLLTSPMIATAAELTLAPIALSGDPAPHDPLLTLEDFPEAPVISNNHHVLFKATDSNGDMGLMAGMLANPPVPLFTVVLQGDPSPVNANVVFTDFSHYEVADNGDILFSAELEDLLSGDIVNGVYVLDASTGILNELAREQASSPIDPAAIIDSLSSNSTVAPVINASGQVAFYAKEDLAEDAIWFGDGALLEVAARNGEPIVNIAHDFSNLQATETLVLNDLGIMSFHGANSGGPVAHSLFSGPSGAVELVFENGSLVPPALVLSFVNAKRPAINNADELFFMASYGVPVPNASDSGLHSTDPDVHILQEGGLLVNSDPALGEVFADLIHFGFDTTPVINDNQVVALQGKLQYTALPDRTAILGGPTGAIRILAREDDPVNATTLNGMFSAPVVNAHNLIAFQAELSNSGEAGLFLVEPGGVGTLHPLALPDDTFVHPVTGAVETVVSARFAGGSGNHDGRPSGLSDDNTPVLQLSFNQTSPESGVFTLLHCDLDADGAFHRRDVRKFFDGCQSNSSLVRCDVNLDGAVNRQDMKAFRRRCR